MRTRKWELRLSGTQRTFKADLYRKMLRLCFMRRTPCMTAFYPNTSPPANASRATTACGWAARRANTLRSSKCVGR